MLLLPRGSAKDNTLVALYRSAVLSELALPRYPGGQPIREPEVGQAQ